MWRPRLRQVLEGSEEPLLALRTLEDLNAAVAALPGARFRLKIGSGNPMGEGELVSMAESGVLSHLTHLTIWSPRLTDAAAVAVVSALQSQTLRLLDLSESGVGREGVCAIASRLPDLESLSLNEIEISNEGVFALTQAPHFSSLHSLHLCDGSVDAKGAEALAAARHLSLRRLSLSHNPIGDEGARALAGAQHLSNLEELALSGCAIGCEGLSMLLNSRVFSNLQMLHLSENRIQDEGILELVARVKTNMPDLDELLLERNDFGQRGRAALEGLSDAYTF